MYTEVLEAAEFDQQIHAAVAGHAEDTILHPGQGSFLQRPAGQDRQLYVVTLGSDRRRVQAFVAG